ncbi:unnamed protein product [Porites evermanni]|uniref:Uncharacterized protein n=1 Tax=Porites evermanni TaxID=104178 RepID=A0ABN8LFI8_9CNID|nr:unnamed protein product [Porites evermanni]
MDSCVTLDYPVELHRAHNGYPLKPPKKRKWRKNRCQVIKKRWRMTWNETQEGTKDVGQYGAKCELIYTERLLLEIQTDVVDNDMEDKKYLYDTSDYPKD